MFENRSQILQTQLLCSKFLRRKERCQETRKRSGFRVFSEKNFDPYSIFQYRRVEEESMTGELKLQMKTRQMLDLKISQSEKYQ